MSEQTSPTTAEAVSTKASESARLTARFVSEKVVAHTGDAAGRASRVCRSTARSVSEKLRSRASKGGRAALSKLTDAGIKLTGKQQEALERLKSRVSE